MANRGFLTSHARVLLHLARDRGRGCATSRSAWASPSAAPWPRTWPGRLTPSGRCPGVTQGSTLGERVFGNALAGRRADFIGNPDLRHTCSLGLVNPMLRELAETYYQFDEPFVLDITKCESVFGRAGTPLADAIAATVAWYRTRPGAAAWLVRKLQSATPANYRRSFPEIRC